MNKALILLSGGQDSTTCLYWAKKKFDSIQAIGFNYGQRHLIELKLLSVKVLEEIKTGFSSSKPLNGLNLSLIHI